MMACTARGFDAMRRCAGLLEPLLPGAELVQTGHSAHEPGFENTPGLSVLTKEWFEKADALVFFTATGIAVRCIAPFVRDKFTDPAVLVIDENTRFVISLLSGHAGGANRLGSLLAQVLDAQPVITTATDGRGLFAVDTYAAESGLQLSDRSKVKMISARLLNGEPVVMFVGDDSGCAFSQLPENYGQGITLTKNRSEADIILSVSRKPGDSENALYLIPRKVTLGIGCRKGTSVMAIRETAQLILQDTGVFREALSGIASIDLKRDEEGLCDFAKEWELSLTFYSAEQLRKAEGRFTSSSFVQEVTGVDNVCERSAVLLAGEKGTLLAGKKSGSGVTVALGIAGK